MKVFLFVLFLSIESFASSSVDWNKVFDSCLNKANKIDYCQQLQVYEENINNKVNLILAQDLTSFEKDALTLAYFIIKDNISLSWKVKKSIYFNLSYQLSEPRTKILINYNF